jgi:hypothetical protein
MVPRDPFGSKGHGAISAAPRGDVAVRPGWFARDAGGYGRGGDSPLRGFRPPFPHPLLTARARPGIGGGSPSPKEEKHLKLGGSKLRALLGGVVMIAILGVVAGEVGAGPAGATRQASTTASALPRGVRPSAAVPSTILEITPLSLAATLANQHIRATTEQRDAIGRWVAGIEAAKAARAEAEAAAAAQVQVRAEQVTRSSDSSGSAPDWSGAVPTDGDHGDTLACIRAHESDSAGGYSAVNSSSGAGGAYQALPSTWDGYGGYARAQDAPPEVQDQWAREAIAASGTRPWTGSGC